MCNVEVLKQSHELSVIRLSNSGGKLLVAKNNDFLAVISLSVKINCRCFIPLAKLATPVTYDDLYHVVGKLSMKTEYSKYFAAPKFEEHLVNGNVPEEQHGKLLAFIDSVYNSYTPFFAK